MFLSAVYFNDMKFTPFNGLRAYWVVIVNRTWCKV